MHHSCEFQALSDQFLMWEMMVSDNSNLSDNSIPSYPKWENHYFLYSNETLLINTGIRECE